MAVGGVEGGGNGPGASEASKDKLMTGSESATSPASDSAATARPARRRPASSRASKASSARFTGGSSNKVSTARNANSLAGRRTRPDSPVRA